LCHAVLVNLAKQFLLMHHPSNPIRHLARAAEQLPRHLDQLSHILTLFLVTTRLKSMTRQAELVQWGMDSIGVDAIIADDRGRLFPARPTGQEQIDEPLFPATICPMREYPHLIQTEYRPVNPVQRFSTLDLWLGLMK